jgi:hypothetical protein
MTPEIFHQRDEVAAANQSLWRNVNENIKNLHNHLASPDGLRTFLCECAALRCGQSFEMTAREYEAVRADPTCFVVAPGDDHVIEDVEVVIAREPHYWVVQKIGASADVAAHLDPRTKESTGV